MIKKGENPIYPLSGKELDELIDQKFIAGECWCWESADGIATYLGQSMQGFIIISIFIS
jgi:hypothetical protein